MQHRWQQARQAWNLVGVALCQLVGLGNGHRQLGFFDGPLVRINAFAHVVEDGRHVPSHALFDVSAERIDLTFSWDEAFFGQVGDQVEQLTNGLVCVLGGLGHAHLPEHFHGGQDKVAGQGLAILFGQAAGLLHKGANQSKDVANGVKGLQVPPPCRVSSFRVLDPHGVRLHAHASHLFPGLFVVRPGPAELNPATGCQ